MAQATYIAARSQLLAYDHAMVDELIEITEEWEELADGERTSWMSDWDQFALDDVPRLAEYASTDGLTREQLFEYRRLIKRIEQHRDLIRRYGLTMPRVPVET